MATSDTVNKSIWRLWKQYWRFEVRDDSVLWMTPLFAICISDGSPDWGWDGIPRYGYYYGMLLHWVPTHWNIRDLGSIEIMYRHTKAWEMKFDPVRQ